MLNMALLWRREVLNYGHFYKDSVIFCQKQWKKKKDPKHRLRSSEGR